MKSDKTQSADDDAALDRLAYDVDYYGRAAARLVVAFEEAAQSAT